MPRRSTLAMNAGDPVSSIANIGRFTAPIRSWAGSVRRPALDRRLGLSHDGHDGNVGGTLLDAGLGGNARYLGCRLPRGLTRLRRGADRVRRPVG